MAGLLEATIRQWASTSCAPFPCALEVWRYVNAAEGRIAPELPPHSTRREVAALLRDRGGLLQYARDMMTATGWDEVADPGRGDVGVIDLPGYGPTCAICLGGKWMAKGDGLVLIVAAPIMAAWRKPCRKSPPPSSPPLV